MGRKLVNQQEQSELIPYSQPYVGPDAETDIVFAMFRLYTRMPSSEESYLINGNEQNRRIEFIKKIYPIIQTNIDTEQRKYRNNSTDTFGCYSQEQLINNFHNIDMTEITTTQANTIISEAYKHGVKTHKGYPEYRSFTKYKADRLSMYNISPYSLYLFPYHVRTSRIKPFYMLPIYDTGVYKVSDSRYINWHIVKRDGSKYTIEIIDYVNAVDAWILLRMGDITIDARNPYLYIEPYGFRYKVETEVLASEIIQYGSNHLEDIPNSKENNELCVELFNTLFAFERGQMDKYLLSVKDEYKDYATTEDLDRLKAYDNSCSFDVSSFVSGGNITRYIKILTANAYTHTFPANWELYSAFINMNIIVNELIASRKKDSKDVDAEQTDTEKLYIYNDESGRQLINIGGAVFRADDIPRAKRNSPAKILYSTPAWTRRAHIRHYKNGKEVRVRESVCRRKNLAVGNESPKPAMVTVEDNDADFNAKQLCEDKGINFSAVEVFASANDISIAEAVTYFM